MYTIKKNMDYNWTNVPEQSKKQDAGVPRAILTPHANSLPFEERHVTVDETVRVSMSLSTFILDRIIDLIVTTYV